MKRSLSILVLAALLVTLAITVGLLAGGFGSARASTEDQTETLSEESSTQVATAVATLSTSPAESVAATASPSVVNVRVTGTTRTPFFGDQPYEGVGSGVVYSSDGYIITNAHVVSEDGQPADSVEVTFSSGETLTAQIVATDSYTDIAVIKVDASDLVPATFADDDTVTVGEYAIAIGSPLDYSNSVTLGIVSGLGRSIENSGSTALVDLIQTDAAISPGNSGGALLDADARVIGINVAYMPSSTTGAENIGFAIPAGTAVRIAEELMADGEADHAFLGIDYATMTSSLQQRYRLSRDTGVLVTQVDRQGPAAEAGLEAGDIIISMDGEDIGSETDLVMLLRKLQAGDTTTLTVDRDGQEVDLPVTLVDQSTTST